MGGIIQLKYLLDTHIWLWSDPGIFNNKPLGVSLCLRAFVAILNDRQVLPSFL
jgi:hypothetical protein